jgi:hypothetical protein
MSVLHTSVSVDVVLVNTCSSTVKKSIIREKNIPKGSRRDTSRALTVAARPATVAAATPVAAAATAVACCCCFWWSLVGHISGGVVANGIFVMSVVHSVSVENSLVKYI